MTSLRNEKPRGWGYLVIDSIHAVRLNDLLGYGPCVTTWIFVRRGCSDSRTEVVGRGLMDQNPPLFPPAATFLHPVPSSAFLSSLPAIVATNVSSVKPLQTVRVGQGGL